MLPKEELQKINDQFDEEELKRQGFFGISPYRDIDEECFIRANKEGLELFALRLLMAARDSEDVLSSTRENIIPLYHHEDWIDKNSSVFIHYVEPLPNKQEIIPPSHNESTLADKILPYGCILLCCFY